MEKQLPDKWRQSDKSIRAVQVAFELSKTVSDVIREQASNLGLSPSDQIRSIIGLPVKKPKRPRLTVSLSGEDYALLAERYGLNEIDKDVIRQFIRDDLIAYGEKLK